MPPGRGGLIMVEDMASKGHNILLAVIRNRRLHSERRQLDYINSFNAPSAGLPRRGMKAFAHCRFWTIAASAEQQHSKC